MPPIKTDTLAKENTQSRHYTPKSALHATQAFDPTTVPPTKIASNNSQLRKLG
jgi:hypothetical protein